MADAPIRPIDRGRRRRPPTRRSTYVLPGASSIGYLFLLVAWPVSLVAKNTFADGFTVARGHPRPTPTSSHALRLTVVVAVVVGGHQHRVRRGHLDPARALRVPGQAGPQRAHRPAAVGVADRRRPRRSCSSTAAADGWFGPALEERRVPGHLRHARRSIMATTFVALPLVIREVVPVLEEIGTEQEQAARSLGANAVQTLPPHHPAGHQVGRRLRRGAQPGPLARRVRRREGRVRQRARRDPHRHPRRRGEVPQLRQGRRLRHAFLLAMVVGRLHRHRVHHPSQGRPGATDEHRGRATSPSASATSSPSTTCRSASRPGG